MTDYRKVKESDEDRSLNEIFTYCSSNLFNGVKLVAPSKEELNTLNDIKSYFHMKISLNSLSFKSLYNRAYAYIFSEKDEKSQVLQ